MEYIIIALLVIVAVLAVVLTITIVCADYFSKKAFSEKYSIERKR